MTLNDNIYALIHELENFNYRIESLDHIWEVIFPDQKNQWYYLYVVKYQETFYINQLDGNLCTLEVIPHDTVQATSPFGRNSYHENSIEAWEPIIIGAIKWLKTIQKNWMVANKKVYELYPLNRRYGIAPNALIRASLPDAYRIDQELGPEKVKKFVNLVEDGYFFREENATRESMTANNFFDYCKIAYLAGQREEDHVDGSLSGREMYQRYADGRHGGLLEIAGDSAQEFADWIDGKRGGGGHPWEIKRGGNTTHIDLYVTRPSFKKEGFSVTLRGPSIGRLRETLCMFLSIHEAGLPITITEPEGIRNRLLATDNIGIIPRFNSLHRANQHFHKNDNVYDVLHYDDLSRYKRRILPFITWEPLPLLQPRPLSTQGGKLNKLISRPEAIAGSPEDFTHIDWGHQ